MLGRQPTTKHHGLDFALATVQFLVRYLSLVSSLQKFQSSILLLLSTGLFLPEQYTLLLCIRFW